MFVSRNEACYDDVLLNNVLVRYDQRHEYYRLYHGNLYLSEIRRAGLLAYWIVKYRPFTVKMKETGKWSQARLINEAIALHIIFGQIVKLTDRKLRVAQDFQARILHAFREHDLSKEAFMLIAESLYETIYKP